MNTAFYVDQHAALEAFETVVTDEDVASGTRSTIAMETALTAFYFQAVTDFELSELLGPQAPFYWDEDADLDRTVDVDPDVKRRLRALAVERGVADDLANDWALHDLGTTRLSELGRLAGDSVDRSSIGRWSRPPSSTTQRQPEGTLPSATAMGGRALYGCMLRAAVIGVGTPPDEREPGQFGQGYDHARGYQRAKGCELIAAADTNPRYARRFCDVVGLSTGNVYEDHELMLQRAAPDIVSVCTPPGTHAAIVSDCVPADVTAVHCEKPLATTWGTCRSMARECREAGVDLTVNHQRRYARPFMRAKALLDDGEVGSLERIEFRAQNLFDYGVHMFDLCGYFTEQEPVQWVEADVEYETKNVWYGVHQETWARARWEYANGVEGLAVTGDPAAVGATMRLVGDDGNIEIEPDDRSVVRVGSEGGWRSIGTGGDTVDKVDPDSLRGIALRVGRHLPSDALRRWLPAPYTERAVVDVVESVRHGRPSPLRVEHSLAATEVVFACWESERRNDRVSLPLDIDDNPLEAMVESGRFDPESVRR